MPAPYRARTESCTSLSAFANLGYRPPDGGATEDELADAVVGSALRAAWRSGGVDDELTSALVDARAS